MIQWILAGNIPYLLQDDFWCSLCARKGIRIGIWFQVHFILKENKDPSFMKIKYFVQLSDQLTFRPEKQ